MPLYEPVEHPSTSGKRSLQRSLSRFVIIGRRQCDALEGASRGIRYLEDGVADMGAVGRLQERSDQGALLGGFAVVVDEVHGFGDDPLHVFTLIEQDGNA